MRTCYSVFATGSYVKNIPGFVLGRSLAVHRHGTRMLRPVVRRACTSSCACAARDGAEQRVRATQQLASVPAMGHEGWTCDVKRVEPVEFKYVEGGNRSRGGAKRDQ